MDWNLNRLFKLVMNVNTHKEIVFSLECMNQRLKSRIISQKFDLIASDVWGSLYVG